MREVHQGRAQGVGPGQQNVLDSRDVLLLTYATRQLARRQAKGPSGGCYAWTAAQKLPSSYGHLAHEASRCRARQRGEFGAIGWHLGDVSGAGTACNGADTSNTDTPHSTFSPGARGVGPPIKPRLQLLS